METIDVNKIIEGNKLIAEFMYPKTIRIFDNFNLMKYHSSWDWLMPVYRKVKDVLQNIERPSKNHCCHGDIIEVDIHCAVTNIDIKTAFMHIVEFIKWYNLSKCNV